MIQKVKNILNDKRLWLYGSIGLSGALIDLLFYIFFYKQLGIPPVIASFLSVSVGILNNFILNSKFNFKITDKLLSRFVIFYGIGVGGAVIASLLILVLFNGLGVDPTVAKIITIPPVVFVQYLLNKHFSFSKKSLLGRDRVKSFFSQHTMIVLINIFFILIALFFVKYIPNERPSGGPDESTHFTYNVEFILKNHSLPVSGKDDIAAYSSCNDTPFSQVPCLYSYQVFPAANYVFSAVSAWISNEIFGISYLKGARLASVFFGVIFINIIYLTGLRLAKNYRIAAMIAASVAFIPQLLFTTSYVNQDAHSLAIGAFAIYTIVRFMQDRDTKSAVLTGIAWGGLIPLAKYNYFSLYAVLVTLLIFSSIKRYFNKKVLVFMLLASVISFILLGAFWYVRNYILYNDPLGQSFVLRTMSQYHVLGPIHNPLSFETLGLLADSNFFSWIFSSFFGYFGYVYFPLDSSVYEILRLLVITTLGATLYLAISSKSSYVRKYCLLTVAGSLLFIAIAWVMVYLNTTTYDFQPQGRYLYAIIPVVAAATAYLYRLESSFKYTILLLLLTTTYAFVSSVDLIMRIYL